MKLKKLNFCEFVVPEKILEDIDMRSPLQQFEEYKKSVYASISKLNTLAFQLQSYNKEDKQVFQSRNLTPIVSGLRSCQQYFTTVGDKLNMVELITQNLNEFKKAVLSGTTFTPKYSWNPMEDQKLGQMYSTGSVDITPAQEVQPVNRNPQLKISHNVAHEVPIIHDRIGLDRK